MNENKNNNNKKNSYSAAMQKQQKNSKGNTFKYTGPINTSQGSVGSAYSTTSTPSKRSDDNYESQQQVEEIQFPQLSPDVFKSQPLLLRDEQIISFITNGYLVIKPEELPKEWHNQLYKKSESLNLMSRKTNPGNNILPLLPELQKVFDCPSVKGALQSLLGNNFHLHAHRHPHGNPPGFQTQLLHQDSYFGYSKHPRCHRIRWIMAMYYPQDTTLEMGPTCIVPTSQYSAMMAHNDRKRKVLPAAWDVNEQPMVCDAGTVVLIHYDIWHKGMGNNSNINRYMFKFQFIRTEEPSSPSWNTSLPDDTPPTWPFQSHPLEPLWMSVWYWLRGVTGDLPVTIKSRDDPAALLKKIEELDTEDAEPKRLNASYTLGLWVRSKSTSEELKEQCLNLLRKGFLLSMDKKSKEYMLRNISYGFSTAGQSAVEFLVQCLISNPSVNLRMNAAFALAEMGTEAVTDEEENAPAAITALAQSLRSRDEQDRVKVYVAEALGTVCQYYRRQEGSLLRAEVRQSLQGAVQALLEICRVHTHDQLRMNCSLSLALLGPYLPQWFPNDETSNNSNNNNANNNNAQKNDKLTTEKIIDRLECIATEDTNRYVKSYCLLALERVNTIVSKNRLIKLLWTARWCPITNPNSQF